MPVPVPVPNPSPTPVSNLRLYRALRSDRFFYKTIWMLYSRDFWSPERQQLHRLLFEAIHTRASRTRSQWIERTTGNNQVVRDQEIDQWRGYFSCYRHDTLRTWGPFLEGIRDLIPFARSQQERWNENFYELANSLVHARGSVGTPLVRPVIEEFQRAIAYREPQTTGLGPSETPATVIITEREDPAPVQRRADPTDELFMEASET